MISVCLATHNGEKYIAQQLSSILNQIGEQDEVIVSDDSSEDRTLNIVRAFNDERIKITGPGFFGSPIKNFEHALSMCTGEYIFLSDQDDIWHENKVKLVMDHLTNGSDLINTDCTVVDDEMNIIVPSLFQLNQAQAGLFRNLLKNSFMGCCMAFNRKVLGDAMPFPKNIPMHDVWIGLIAQARYTVTFINKPLLFYRQHDNNASPTARGVSKNSLCKKLSFRLILINQLFNRILLSK